jgi:hypothetical protein
MMSILAEARQLREELLPLINGHSPAKAPSPRVL